MISQELILNCKQYLLTHVRDLVHIDIERIIEHLKLEEKNFQKIEETWPLLARICNNLTSVMSPDYQLLAGKIYRDIKYLEIYGSEKATPSLRNILEKGISLKIYDSNHSYSTREIEFLGKCISHAQDLQITYGGWLALERKYLAHHEQKIIETPQIMYMLIAMYGFMHEDTEFRLARVVQFYRLLSSQKINLPTPVLISLRKTRLQCSSCVLLEAGDSIISQAKTIENVMLYSANNAGFGVSLGGIRGLGSKVRGGIQFHQGYIPYIRLLESAIKSVSQGSTRNGALTAFYPIWNIELESLIVLKNNRGNEANRVRHLDYGVQISQLFYQRLAKQENISLFSSSEVPGLYEAFFRDQEEFERIYIDAENNPEIRKKVIPALELFTMLMTERAQTGRIYIQNVDHCNNYSSFNAKAPSVKGSNLCMEVLLPTTPVDTSDNYELPTCILSALNLGKLGLDEFEEACDLIVRFLDHIIEHQSYPIQAAARTAHKRRYIGVGVTGFAHFLAQNQVKYHDLEARNLVHQTFERMQYYLILASTNLASEKGPCLGFEDTTYSQGILPIDNYKKDIDAYHTAELQLDWEYLRSKLLKHGMRNSTLSAIMPCESSSIVSNSTNGIEAPRSPISSKQSKHGVVKFVVPDYLKLKEHYSFLWDLPSNEDYLALCGIMQKFIDQSISTNTSYDPNKYEQRMVSLKDILGDILLAYKLGLKTLYYHNTLDEASLDKASVTKEAPDCGCII